MAALRQKFNLPAILTHNITKNVKVVFVIAKTAPQCNLLEFFACKAKKKVKVVLMFGKIARNYVAQI